MTHDIFAGRVAFISGGASGIGLGLARALAGRGTKLALADIQPAPLEAVADELRALGADVMTLTLDVADRTAVYAAADAVEQRFGKVHYVFNNAGVGELGTPIDVVTHEIFDWVLNVNLFGVFNAIKAFTPKVRQHGEGGRIVNTASMAAFLMMPDWHQGIYSATKMGVVALSADLADSLRGTGIGVSVVYPGTIETNILSNVQALRPQRAGAEAKVVPDMLANGGMSPATAAEIILRGMANDDFHILTHPELWPMVEDVHQGIANAFRKAAATAHAH